jgi:hypothetical protein
MSYSNVPGYTPAPAFKPARSHRFAIATRVPGHGAVVTSTYPTEGAAKRARVAIMRRHEFVTPVLKRTDAGDWIPVNPKLARHFASA